LQIADRLFVINRETSSLPHWANGEDGAAPAITRNNNRRLAQGDQTTERENSVSRQPIGDVVASVWIIDGVERKRSSRKMIW
jgi:hypothetical protein